MLPWKYFFITDPYPHSPIYLNQHRRDSHEDYIKNHFTNCPGAYAYLFQLAECNFSRFYHYCSGQYKNMLFMGTVISNSLIGIIQECKVKSLIDKLSVITATKARKLAADGTITEIPIESLAVSDTIHIMTGDQIVADGEVLTRMD